MFSRGTTVRGIVSTVTEDLAAVGIESAAAEARLLVQAVTGWDDGQLMLQHNETVPKDSPLLTELPNLVARRLMREPLQHILGTAPMIGIELKVGPGVFIPRPETELLVDWAVQQLQELPTAPDERPLVFDLCTGSGAIALAIADLVPDAEVIGVELEPTALDWAEKNLRAQLSRWRDTHHVRFAQADVTDSARFSHLKGRAQVVVSNPPYVPDGTEVSPEVAVDPRHAVFGGSDGLDVIRPMLRTIVELLAPGGVVGIEHDDDSGADVSDLMSAAGVFADITTHRDLAGRDRFTTARYLPKSQEVGESEEQ